MAADVKHSRKGNGKAGERGAALTEMAITVTMIALLAMSSLLYVGQTTSELYCEIGRSVNLTSAASGRKMDNSACISPGGARADRFEPGTNPSSTGQNTGDAGFGGIAVGGGGSSRRP